MLSVWQSASAWLLLTSADLASTGGWPTFAFPRWVSLVPQMLHLQSLGCGRHTGRGRPAQEACCAYTTCATDSSMPQLAGAPTQLSLQRCVYMAWCRLLALISTSNRACNCTSVACILGQMSAGSHIDPILNSLGAARLNGLLAICFVASFTSGLLCSQYMAQSYRTRLLTSLQDN